MRLTCKYGATRNRTLTYLRIVRLLRSAPAVARRLGLSVGRSGESVVSEKTRANCRKYYRAHRDLYKEKSRNWSLAHPERTKWYALKTRSKEEGMPFLITRSEFSEWYLSQKKICSYCDLIELKYDRSLSNGSMLLFFSIDRKNSDLPYTLGNMCLCCWNCNSVKSNTFTEHEFREIAQKYLKPKWQKKLELINAN